jgi:2-iminobutanoate/2-iminopropanoate deaminase
MRLLLLILPLLWSGCPLFEPPPPTPITREVIQTPDAPAAIGPYSQAIKVGNTLYCSGQLGIDPVTHELVRGDIQDETRQVLKNLGAILKAGGVDYGNVTTVSVFLTNLDDFKLVNEVYQTFFADQPPARATVQVARLPLNEARVEISCIAIKTDQ